MNEAFKKVKKGRVCCLLSVPRGLLDTSSNSPQAAAASRQLRALLAIAGIERSREREREGNRKEDGASHPHLCCPGGLGLSHLRPRPHWPRLPASCCAKKYYPTRRNHF